MFRPSGSAPPQYRQSPDATIERWPVADSVGCAADFGAGAGGGAAGGGGGGAGRGAACAFGAWSGTPNVGRSAIAA
jgi:hypothetical protein